MYQISLFSHHTHSPHFLTSTCVLGFFLALCLPHSPPAKEYGTSRVSLHVTLVPGPHDPLNHSSISTCAAEVSTEIFFTFLIVKPCIHLQFMVNMYFLNISFHVLKYSLNVEKLMLEMQVSHLTLTLKVMQKYHILCPCLGRDSLFACTITEQDDSLLLPQQYHRY